jgi:hypothetical protein
VRLLRAQAQPADDGGDGERTALEGHDLVGPGRGDPNEWRSVDLQRAG